MLFAYLLPLVTCLTHLSLVLSNDLNVGFEASIDITGIDIFPAESVAFVAGPSTVDYTFIVPVTINRLGSSLEALTVRLFTQLYDYDEDGAPTEAQVYSEDIYMNERSTYNVYASFNATTNVTASIVYSLRAQVDVADNSLGGTAYVATISGAAVTSYNATSGQWSAYQPSDYAHEQNVMITAQYEGEMATLFEPPIDTTNETVIINPDPDLPEEEDPNVTTPNPPVEGVTGGGNTPIPPCEPYTPPPTPLPCHGEVKPGDPCEHYKSWRRNNVGKPWKGPEYCEKPWKTRDNDKTPWIDTKPCTTSATPRPPSSCTPPHPPACSFTSKHPAVYQRQSTARGILQLTVNYGTANEPVPVRQLPVTAFGLINNERKYAAVSKTNNDGFAALQFPLNPGETVVVYRVSVLLDTEKFRVSTSNDNGTSFLIHRLNSIDLEVQVPEGRTEYTYRFMNKATNDILNVQDRMLTYWIFAKTKVANFRAKLGAVWFPGIAAANSFNARATLDVSFINVHPEKAKATTPLAHEYGHWFHYLARKQQYLNTTYATKSHNFCQQDTANSAAVAVSEGYATAFGLSALWQSKFQEANGTGYCFFPFNAASPNCCEIEQYDCDSGPASRDLSIDEGRVAALLRDLIDAGADDNENDDGRGVNGFSDNANLVRARVLFDPMRGNPASMQEYW
jgi:hypothetical protein